jgi:hypothetical protein
VDWTIVGHLLAVPVLHDGGGGGGAERFGRSRWRRQPKVHTSSPLPTPSSASRNFSSYFCPTFYIKFLEDTLEYAREAVLFENHLSSTYLLFKCFFAYYSAPLGVSLYRLVAFLKAPISELMFVVVQTSR